MENNVLPCQTVSVNKSKITLTIFSDSPFHLLAKLDADILKNTLSFATAFANRVLPVPGGPNKSIPFIAFLIP